MRRCATTATGRSQRCASSSRSGGSRCACVALRHDGNGSRFGPFVPRAPAHEEARRQRAETTTTRLQSPMPRPRRTPRKPRKLHYRPRAADGTELGARCQVWASRRSRMPYEFRPTAGKQVCENRGIVRTRHVRRGSRRRVTLLDLGRTRRDATVPVRADVLSRRRLRPRYAHGTRYGACLAVRRRLK